MVVKEDGTKWACQSCLKGHRVSGCTHTDRPLQFVPKKGRPVTQCQHCRVERKKRSAHVKCDCGDKTHASKEKCVHLRNAESSDNERRELGAVPEGEESDEHTCCCHHGEKCTCSTVKKEIKDDHHAPPSARAKPHLTATRSEGHLTVFANGHHKPCHRNNHAAHDANTPYRVHKPHAHPAHGMHAAGRRSVDSLSSVERTSKFSLDQLQELATSQGPTSQPTVSAPPSEPSQSYAAFTIPADTNVGSADAFFGSAPSTSGFQQPQMSADIGNDVSWAGYDWSSLVGMDNAQPALTYASSNTISELGEHTPPDDIGATFAQHNMANNMTEMSGQLSQIPESQPSFQAQSTRQVDNSQNRWSLPPSFWAETGNMDFSQAFPTNSVAMDASKDMQTMRSKDFGVTDWSSFIPPPVANNQHVFAGNSDMQWTPDASSNQPDFNLQALSGSVDGSANAFDFGQDAMDAANFHHTPEDPFFGLESAEPVDFIQDFSQSGSREIWPS
ncbi:Metal-binding regulatory protein cuf1 [Sphaceloma murrayae]|uniref:Metal-binding regulatory protein cuf1 n=1 Tax=Sphaceloma murrayae TaxID=2082308 RepID=A0A2K1QGZ8_9PEZI|nr:Metal-binding regulatory protein cuf1 [Sphaceloma murrayae]